MSVQVELTVGMIDMSLAQLLTSDHRIIEFPSILLPDDVVSGSIVKLSCERSSLAEEQDNAKFRKCQEQILQKFTRSPQVPNLRVHNYTQTSVVLEWDPVDPGSAELLGLALYKNGQQLGAIPNPERRTSTKLSNLEIDKQYQFELVLTTSAGTLKSNLINVHTHKMTDLSGLTVCIGSLEGSDITLEDIESTISHIGCRPLQHEVQLDTTHFICTEPDTNQYVRAQVRNMPIVRPQWLKACEDERRLVEVRQYYLSEDPRLMAPHRTRRASVATAATGDVSVAEDSYAGSDQPAESQANSSSEHPEITVSPPEGDRESDKGIEHTGTDHTGTGHTTRSQTEGEDKSEDASQSGTNGEEKSTQEGNIVESTQGIENEPSEVTRATKNGAERESEEPADTADLSIKEGTESENESADIPPTSQTGSGPEEHTQVAPTAGEPELKEVDLATDANQADTGELKSEPSAEEDLEISEQIPAAETGETTEPIEKSEPTENSTEATESASLDKASDNKNDSDMADNPHEPEEPTEQAAPASSTSDQVSNSNSNAKQKNKKNRKRNKK